MKLLFAFMLNMSLLAGEAQIVIRNTTIVDVENKKLDPNMDVLIENGTIREINKNIKAPKGTKLIDGKGKYLVPGFTDAHIHFFQSGGIYTRPDVIDLRKYKPYDQELRFNHEHMDSFARRYAAAGITTVIDVGASISFLKQRDSLKAKKYIPTIYMTGPLLTTYEPEEYFNLDDDEPFYKMNNEDEARNYVRKQLPWHPDFIKIWYIAEGQDKDSSAKANFPLVKAVVDESHKNGLRVAVHATERTTAQLAVEAGADFLVHSVDDKPLNKEFIELLKKKNTVLCPTLVVLGNYRRVFAQEYENSEEDIKYAYPEVLKSVHDLKDIRDTALTNQYMRYVSNTRNRFKTEDSLSLMNLKALSDAGVTIATGTDAGNIGTMHVSSFFDEIKAMEKSGLNIWHILQASTINGAKAIGREAEFGSVKKGKRADLLLLDKNPIDDLNNWQSIRYIFNKGELIKPAAAQQN